MINHTEILNHLIKKYNLKTYLEIGVQWKENFNNIKLDESYKYCVDPNPESEADFIGTSDAYFEKDNTKFDLVFIDGDHTSEQVKKDFENAMSIVSDNGFIVLHDTVPRLEERTFVPRVTKQWNGDVYKFACTLNEYKKIDFKTYSVDHGVTVVWKSKGKKKTPSNKPITWDYFTEFGAILLRFYNNLPEWNKK